MLTSLLLTLKLDHVISFKSIGSNIPQLHRSYVG